MILQQNLDKIASFNCFFSHTKGVDVAQEKEFVWLHADPGHRAENLRLCATRSEKTDLRLY